MPSYVSYHRKVNGLKILVFSDSHGRISPMLDLIRLHKPDMIFHLGDVSRDLEPLYLEWPELKVVGVPGNCDGWTGQPLERIVEVEGVRFLLSHGHAYHVKAGLGGLIAAAREQEVDAALFGHTHVPYCEQIDGIWFFNPGSVGSYCCADYGIITVEEGSLTCRLEQKR